VHDARRRRARDADVAPPQIDNPRPRICVAQGADKVVPLRAALAGRIINGMVTDESTARALLED
jgi:DNA-binding transcriptional regulator LsrR (DeoR family)